MIFALVGRPGSGKSTVGKIVASETGAMYISSGDIAREIASGSNEFMASLKNGAMAPEEAMREKIAERIDACIDMGRDVILDGFPRFIGQNIWLNQRYGSITMIGFDIPYQESLSRLANRGRYDDGSCIQRNEFYDKYTIPMFNTELRGQKTYAIDAEKSISSCVYETTMIIKYSGGRIVSNVANSSKI